MSEHTEHNDWLNQLADGFDAWSPEEPSNRVWDELSENLSIERVWQSLDEPLKSAGSDADTWIKEPYEQWDAEIENDGWLKLNEELSRERVWMKLTDSLNRPSIFTFNWMQVAAVFLIFFSLSFPLVNQMMTFETTVLEATAPAETLTPAPSATETIEPASANTAPSQVAQNATPANRLQQTGNAGSPIEVQEKNRVENTVAVHQASTSSSGTSSEKESITDLGAHWNLPGTSGKVQRLPIDFHRTFTPSLSVSFGPQLSIIQSSDQNNLMTHAPRLGMTAQVGYRKTFKAFFAEQKVGFAQFAQTNGRYINGRYYNSNQRLNTLQFNTGIGLRYKRFDIGTSVGLTKVLNGTEQQVNKITNIYNPTKLELGLGAEIGARLTSNESKTQVGISLGYQWIPTITSSNVTFSDVQGLSFKTKISF